MVRLDQSYAPRGVCSTLWSQTFVISYFLRMVFVVEFLVWRSASKAVGQVRFATCTAYLNAYGFNFAGMLVMDHALGFVANFGDFRSGFCWMID